MIKEGINKYKSEKVWLLFFVMMFCFFTNTIVQYASHGFLLLYVFTRLYKIKALQIEKFRVRRLLYAVGGYGLFIVWIILTKKFAYGVLEGSGTLISLIKLLAVGVLLGIDIDSGERVIRIMISYVEALAIMCAVILATSHPSTYGTISFGGITHQFRNTIANATFFGLVFVWYLSGSISNKRGVIYSALFLCTGLLGGSRRGIVQLVLLLLVYGITEKGIKRKLRMFMLFCVLAFAVSLVVTNIPFLKEEYIPRLLSIFSSSIDDGSAASDMSTIGRNLYRAIGMYMFSQRPITGYGIDGFYLYLADNPFAFSTYRLNAVYSHCNYVEILADFGLVGFFLYYSMHIKLIKSSIRYYSDNRFARLVLIIVGTTFILDYGGISFDSFFAMYMYYLLLYGVSYRVGEVID